MLNLMRIDEGYRLGSLGPWKLYKPEEGTYVFVIDTEDEGVEMEEGSDNFIIVSAGSFTEAIDVFSAAMS